MRLDTVYDEAFFRSMDRMTVRGAEAVTKIIGQVLPRLESAVDVGCGVGTWLRVLNDAGVGDVLGVDGAWARTGPLRIPETCFHEHDLSRALHLERRFDVAISCEVAEHLPKASAKGFVSSLCRLSDFVLFSAAIPLQGGVNHLNEQWPTYWLTLFEKQGYVAIDVIRKRIWNDTTIASYYRQNILLFVKQERVGELRLQLDVADTVPPEKYLLTYQRLTHSGIRHSLWSLNSSIRRRFGW